LGYVKNAEAKDGTRFLVYSVKHDYVAPLTIMLNGSASDQQ